MREQVRDLVELVRLGPRVNRRLAAAVLAHSLLTNIAFPLRALWFKFLVDATLRGNSTQMVVYAIALSLSDGLRSWALLQASILKLDLADRGQLHFQTEAMCLCGELDGIAQFESPAYLDRLTQLRNGFPTLAGAYATTVDAVALTTRITVTTALLAWAHPALVVLPLFALPSLWAGRRSDTVVQEAGRLAAPEERRARSLEEVTLSTSAAKELRVFGLGGELRARLARALAAVDARTTRAQLRGELVKLAGWSLFAAAYAAGVGVVASQVASGSASAGDLALVVFLGAQVNAQVAEAATTVATVSSLGTILGHRRWLVRFAGGQPAEAAGGAAPEILRSGIRLSHVRYSYPGSDSPALEDVSVELPAGSIVAVAGENGAGKSTLVKLLLKLYAPTGGTISIDGTDLAEISTTGWRARTTGAFEDLMRYEFRVSEAVGVGHPPDIDDEARVGAAIAAAGAEAVPAGLSDGLASQLGPTFGGADLSGGEWQLLALSRALMPPRPLLQVLDEPGAALDAHNEHQTYQRHAEAVRRAASETGTVSVFVAHRFPSVTMADLILVLDRGRLVETGTHDELVASGGLYAELYGMAARAYR